MQSHSRYSSSCDLGEPFSTTTITRISGGRNRLSGAAPHLALAGGPVQRGARWLSLAVRNGLQVSAVAQLQQRAHHPHAFVLSRHQERRCAVLP